MFVRKIVLVSIKYSYTCTVHNDNGSKEELEVPWIFYVNIVPTTNDHDFICESAKSKEHALLRKQMTIRNVLYVFGRAVENQE